ncbi:MAG: Septum formation initiator [Marmoricola sp.]|nr:Septum formation initiator [Marmoricola sp.]
MILLVVLAILVVSYASSMRAYLQQSAHIADLKVQIAEAERATESAKTERGRWADPAYVETQARQRFGWVMPGETAYQVLDQDGNPLTGDDRLTDPASVAPDAPVAWWSRLRESVDAADHPEKLVKPTPAKQIKPSTPASE